MLNGFGVGCFDGLSVTGFEVGSFVVVSSVVGFETLAPLSTTQFGSFVGCFVALSAGLEMLAEPSTTNGCSSLAVGLSVTGFGVGFFVGFLLGFLVGLEETVFSVG